MLKSSRREWCVLIQPTAHTRTKPQKSCRLWRMIEGKHECLGKGLLQHLLLDEGTKPRLLGNAEVSASRSPFCCSWNGACKVFVASSWPFRRHSPAEHWDCCLRTVAPLAAWGRARVRISSLGRAVSPKCLVQFSTPFLHTHFSTLGQIY